jgi:aspartate kinase
MIVLKFGGTSMGSAKRMQDVAELVWKKGSCLVVLSAMSGVTDTLLKIAGHHNNHEHADVLDKLQFLKQKFGNTSRDLFQHRNNLDATMSYLETAFKTILQKLASPYSLELENWLIVQGEMITSRIFTAYLNDSFAPAMLLNAPDFMVLDEKGEPDLAAIERLLLPKINHNIDLVYVTQGFVCRNHDGEIDTLQRGGSDYSATLIGAAINAEIIEIWTDIDGMQNNDPREVQDTFSIRKLSFEEAAELAYFGAKILHPACVWPARKTNIPIWLRNTMEPENPGTMIRKTGEQQPITAIAAKDQITAIRIKSGRMLNTYGFLVKVFSVFAAFKTPIDMITTSEVAVSLTIDNNSNLDEIVGELEKYGTVEVDRDQSIICVVGDFLFDKSDRISRILYLLRMVPIRMISYGGSQNNITFLVSTTDKNLVLNELNNGLFTLTNALRYA